MDASELFETMACPVVEGIIPIIAATITIMKNEATTFLISIEIISQKALNRFLKSRTEFHYSGQINYL